MVLEVFWCKCVTRPGGVFSCKYGLSPCLGHISLKKAEAPELLPFRTVSLRLLWSAAGIQVLSRVSLAPPLPEGDCFPKAAPFLRSSGRSGGSFVGSAEAFGIFLALNNEKVNTQNESKNNQFSKST